MKALSLQEPYAWLVLQRAYEDDPRKPLKPIENRPRSLPKTFAVPQRIWIHASMTMYHVSLEEIRAKMTASQWLRCKDYLHSIYREYETYHNRDRKWLQRIGYFGCLLGSITITGQVTESEDPWFFGPYGYILEDPQMLKKAIPYKGQLGFFEIAKEIIVG